ncbi:GNAT family N-acetyltransferase [Paenibacillus hemerocallicola]|uniref:GNAT family N-acetyltransferase n=1 Tax=Paenibacillus hemerocallicola TaxID=1172614 RepID=A0A5C4TBY5_9BACL|nr:GNAT family N-acetyltransferase [Paenibacillus hemerocallicola]TNJ66435.1 GNAT family N-acetyltransferase [Paenibacillus hemerocallicola]
MQTCIRPIQAHELDDLFRLVEQFSTSFEPDKVQFQESMSQLLSDEAAFLRVALHDSKLIGYCLGFDHYTLYANGRVSWLEEIMVDETYRNQGIGKQLMDCFEEWTRLRKSQLIALATRRAATFYKGLGYQESAVYFRKLL